MLFKPKYYILAEHTGNHYKLITYKGKKNFRFHEIPHGIKKLIQEKCMESSGKNIFSYIPKFNPKGHSDGKKEGKKKVKRKIIR